MSESVSIPVELLAETRAALDAALRLSHSYGVQNEAAHDAAKEVWAAKVKLDTFAKGNCVNIATDKRQAGYQLLRRLDELRREIKKDYGLEK